MEKTDISLFNSVYSSATSDNGSSVFSANNSDGLDPLTGLYLYPAFLARAQEELDSFDENKCYAVVYSDINNFSYLNEHFGYEAGDDALKYFAHLLRTGKNNELICCRINGDRFITFSVFNSKKNLEERITLVNNTFEEECHKKYPLSDLRISCGIYYIKDPKEYSVIRCIDFANRARKYVYNNHYAPFFVYTEEFSEKLQNQINIVGGLHDAIEAGEIEAFFQPKFSMKTMQVIGAEALSRWKNPDGGYRQPLEFIPVLESSGYIIDLDFYILEQVLKTLSKWKNAGIELIPISVNFSRVHVKHGDFINRFLTLIEKYDISPEYIDIEFTESMLSGQEEKLMDYIRILRNKGHKIVLDDFGTGYSSLHMLLDVPTDVIKIDKSFIDNYQTDAQRDYIDRIGKLVLSVKKDIIFEGVEDFHQIEFLTKCGYEKAQGFVFSKPIPISEFEEKYIKKVR